MAKPRKTIPPAPQQDAQSTLTPPQAITQAMAAYSRRDWPRAEHLCRLVLSAKSDYFDALNLLGAITAQTMRLTEAEALFGRAVLVQPDNAEAYLNRGIALRRLQQPDAAVASHDKAISLKPDFAEAHYNRGNAILELRQLDAAIASYEKAISLRCDYLDAHNSLGNAIRALKQPKTAIASYDHAISIKQDFADAYCNRGDALMELKQLDAAIASYEQAICISPDHLKTYNNRGNALLELRQLEAAIASYDKAISLNPTHPELYNNRGVALLELKQPEAAIASFGLAIGLRHDYADAYSNRGNAFLVLQQPQAAIADYDLAISLKHDYADAYNNRGNAFTALDQPEAAIASYDKAICLRPDHLEAYNNRGNALLGLHQPEAALASYEKTICIERNYADAYNNRGNALLALKLPDNAVSSYDRAISLKRDYAEAYYNRGNALLELKQADDAVASYDKSIGIKHDYAEAYNNRGNALRDLKKPEAAITSYNNAIHITPDYAEAYSNRGVAHQELQQPDNALASYNRAIDIKPEYAEAHFNKSLTLLVSGAFASGWELYEWRWKCAAFAPLQRNFPQPLWLGAESIKDQTILLHSEQGLGDTLQFCRYVRLVAALGAHVVLEVDAELLPLLARLEGVERVIANGAPPPAFDYHCPLLSLPLAFKATLNTIPAPGPYLYSDSGKIEFWAGKLGMQTKPRVGLVWSGGATHQNDRDRSLTLQSLLPYLPDKFEYVSLQKEVRAADQPALQSSAIRHFGEALQDFTDTAALCDLMDLVISVDTAVAHLAGALGKKTWVLLPYAPDWRWLLDREDSPWYPSLKLYRQNQIGDWPGVLGGVNADLKMLKPAQGQAKKTSPPALWQPPAPQGMQTLPQVITQVMAAYDNRDWSKAERLCRLVLNADATYFDALNCLGAITAQTKRLDEAMDLFSRAVAVMPNNAEAYYNRGRAFQDLKQMEAAVASYDQAISIKHDHATAYNNRGLALQELKQLEAAVASFDQAISIKHDYASTYSNRGRALQELKQLDVAVASFDQAIGIKSNDANVYLNKSFALLLSGDFANGLRLYEWRWENADLKNDKRNFSRPLWLGAESIKNKAILLYSEQGLGDVIQFCRYAKHVAGLGAKVILEAPKSLMSLLQSLNGVAAVVEKGKALPAFDYHCPLLSLPLAFKTTLNTIPAPSPYLHSEASKVDFWARRLGVKTKPRVGLVWSGSTIHKNDRDRSLALQSLLPYLPDTIEYVSLQKEVRDADQPALQSSAIRHFGVALEDFSDSAALCDLMDLVISVDTAVAHLAGALGKKTWVLLPYAPDWRWLLNREDSPWYPSLKLYRQDRNGDWTGVLGRVNADLKMLTPENLPVTNRKPRRIAKSRRTGTKP